LKGIEIDISCFDVKEVLWW